MGDGKDKKQRNDNELEHRPHHSMAASTDVADLVQDNSAHHASAHQRKEATDERFGEGAKADVHARILQISVMGDMTRITIGSGPKQGVMVGMEGYIRGKHGTSVAEFQIDQADDRVSHAMVKATPDMIYASSEEVVVNPTQKPKVAFESCAKHALQSRVIKNQIIDGKTKLMFGLGEKQGARIGQKGYLHSDTSDTPYMHFTIIEATDTTCSAFIETTIDDVHAHPHVVINPSEHGPAKPH